MELSSDRDPKVLGKRHAKHGAELGRFAAYLRTLYPRDTAAHVAAAAGLKVRTVEAWLEQRATPGFACLVALLRAFGPMPLAVLCPENFGWLDDAVRAAKREEIDREIRKLEAAKEAL